MRQTTYAFLITVFVWTGITLNPRDVSAQTVAPLPSTHAFGTAAAKDFTPSIGQIFADTITDFRRLPSRESAIILGVGGLSAFAGHQADTRTSQTFSGFTSLRGAFGAGDTIGAATTQLAAAFATYSLGRATGNAKVGMLGADLMRAQLVSQGVTQAVKLSVGRTRPDGTSMSFPSGHSASAFATATVLQRHLGWKAGIPAYGVAAYVAASRIQNQRHYLSDVAFGAAIGIVAGRTVTIGHGNARFSVSPTAAPGGAGVNFTWVGKN
jgi:membrane-associated phospholipid phosphatase